MDAERGRNAWDMQQESHIFLQNLETHVYCGNPNAIHLQMGSGFTAFTAEVSQSVKM